MKCEICQSEHKVQRYKGEKPLCNKHYKLMYRHGEIPEYHRKTPNEIIINEEYAELVLRDNNGEITTKSMIDLEDVERVKQYKWSLSNGYIQNHKNKMLLHRFLINAPKDKYVDHINSNPLDNRKCNLRLCTSQENLRNSLCEGVSYAKNRTKWRAYIMVDRKQIFLGYFITKEEATKARIEGEKKYFGEFAPTRGI